jgi:hypothetical protein
MKELLSKFSDKLGCFLSMEKNNFQLENVNKSTLEFL